MDFLKPKYRVVFAWILLIGGVVAWPITQVTVARGEPPFTLGLSWFAVILTALDILSTADVRKNEDENKRNNSNNS